MSNAQPGEIWIGRGDDRLGPHAFENFRDLHADGRLQRDDLIWWDGLAEWIDLDVAVAKLGLARAAPTPPPLPPTRKPSVPPRVTKSASASAGDTGERGRTLGLAFAGLIAFAVLAAAAFAFLRVPNVALPSFGASRSEMTEVLGAASIYKVAYAEYVMTTAEVPDSLEAIGMSSTPYGATQAVRIDAGTLIFDTRHGVLALQPFSNANDQIQFRCGLAAPPAGMSPLGRIDSAAVTTVAASDLPDDCR